MFIATRSTMWLRAAAGMLSVLLAGCIPGGVLTNKDTAKTSEISAIQVPTNKYDDWSCDQIAGEATATKQTMAEMAPKLEQGDYDKSGTLIVTPFFLMYDNTK